MLDNNIFYSRFNNVLSVIGKGSREMCTLHLNKVYCLPSLTYGCETWTLNDQSMSEWNNSFRHIILSGFWRESWLVLVSLDTMRVSIETRTSIAMDNSIVHCNTSVKLYRFRIS